MRKLATSALLLTAVCTLDAAARVTISPTSVTVNTGASVSFTAKAVGTNKKIQWRASCGVIDTQGHYTAPAAAQTCQVTAAAGTVVSSPSVVTVVAPVTQQPPPPPPPPPAPTPTSTSTGTVLYVQAASGALETALSQATAAAQSAPVTVVLGAGDYVGNFVFPRSGALYPITFTADPATLPAAGTRIDPTYEGRLPRLVPSYIGSPTVTVQGDGYNFRGLQVVAPDVGVTSIDLDATMTPRPSNITFDQMLIRGNDATGGHRGVGINGINVSVTNSWIDRMWESGRDAQAVAAWDTPGPLRIENNYLQASGEDFLLGGSVPTCACVPTGVVFTRNFVTKDIAWMTATTLPEVKNLLEVKFGAQITITGNIFEHNWQQAQTGWSILFTAMGIEGTAWTTVHDVVFSGNIVRNVSSGLNIAAVSGPVSNVRVENNVWQNLDNVTYGGDGRWAMVQTGTDGVQNVTIVHNTVIGISGNQFLELSGSVPLVGFTMTHVVVEHRDYGIHSSMGLAIDALNAMAPGYVFHDNAIIGPPAYWLTWPAGNFELDVPIAAQFDSRYAIVAGSPLLTLSTSYGATVGADPSVLPQ